MAKAGAPKKAKPKLTDKEQSERFAKPLGSLTLIWIATLSGDFFKDRLKKRGPFPPDLMITLPRDTSNFAPSSIS